MECNISDNHSPSNDISQDVFGQKIDIPGRSNKINDGLYHPTGNRADGGLSCAAFNSRGGSLMVSQVLSNPSLSPESNSDNSNLYSDRVDESNDHLSTDNSSETDKMDDNLPGSEEMDEDSLDDSLLKDGSRDFKTWLIPRKEVIKPKDPIESPAPPQRKRSKPLKFKLITTEEDEAAKVTQQTGDLCEDPFQKTHFVKYLKQKDKPKRIWECGICARQFSHQFELTRHLPVHALSNTYACPICGKGFKQLSTLSQHKAMHSRAKPYVCEVCLKCFARVSSLISHKKIHSVHKQFQCDVCGKGFTQKANMQKHMLTHDQNKPYRCEVCNRGFYQIANLLCHRVKAHTLDAGKIGNLPLLVTGDEESSSSCPLCLKKFDSHGSLKHHIETSHFTWLNSKKKPKLINNTRVIQLPSGEKIAIRFQDNNSKLKFDCENIRSSPTNLFTSGESAPLHKIKIAKVLSPEETEALRERERVHREQMYPRNITLPSWKDTIGGTSRMKPILPNNQDMSVDNKCFETIKQGGNMNVLKHPRGVLMKLVEGLEGKQLLVPATSDDIKNSGRVPFSLDNKELGVKSQVRSQLVALVAQKIDDDGQVSLSVEAAGSESDEMSQDHPSDHCDDSISESSIEFLSQHYGDLTSPLIEASRASEISLELLKNLSSVGNDEDGDGPGALDPSSMEMTQMIQFVKEDGSVLTEQEIQALSPGLSTLDFLTGAVNFSAQQNDEVDDPLEMHGNSIEQLALHGLQFLRHCSDGTYEVLDQEEASKLISEPGVELIQHPSSFQGCNGGQVLISNMLPSDVLESHMEEDEASPSHSVVVGQYHQISSPVDASDKYQMIVPQDSVKFILAGEDLHPT